LQEKPWFGDCFEFHARANYEYNYFNKVDHAIPQLSTTFQTHVLGAGIDLTAPETWNYEMEIEFADTSSVSWGYRSFALQVRKLWLDDVCCDPISLSTGLVYRDASSRMRKALSTPYHGRGNFEFHTAIGKEWGVGPYWYFRVFGLAAVGQATQGSPWLRGDLFFWGNFRNCHQWRLYAKSYFGLGSKRDVFIEDFDGWGKIGHHSVDLGASYRFRLGLYGTLRFDYVRRIYARSYPEKVNFFVFTFRFPFSVF